MSTGRSRISVLSRLQISWRAFSGEASARVRCRNVRDAGEGGTDRSCRLYNRKQSRGGERHARVLRKRRASNLVSQGRDRKSTRLNSSHLVISYAVFCLKKKNRHYAMANLQRR